MSITWLYFGSFECIYYVVIISSENSNINILRFNNMTIQIILLISIKLLNLILYFKSFIMFLRRTINKSNYNT